MRWDCFRDFLTIFIWKVPTHAQNIPVLVLKTIHCLPLVLLKIDWLIDWLNSNLSRLMMMFYFYKSIPTVCYKLVVNLRQFISIAQTSSNKDNCRFENFSYKQREASFINSARFCFESFIRTARFGSVPKFGLSQQKLFAITPLWNTSRFSFTNVTKRKTGECLNKFNNLRNVFTVQHYIVYLRFLVR